MLSLGSETGAMHLWSRPGRNSAETGTHAGADVGGGTVLFHHATGLNAGAYRPFLEALDIPHRVLVPCARGHGRTTLPAAADSLKNWAPYVDDMRQLISQMAVDAPLDLMGHSMGGTTMVLVAAGLPKGAVRQLVLIDPVILPRLFYAAAGTGVGAYLLTHMPVVKRTRGRRARWQDRRDAEDYCQRTSFFQPWAASALAGYLDDGLVAADGGQVGLSCHPDWEAATFMGQANPVWRALDQLLQDQVPITILQPNRGSLIRPMVRAQLARAGVSWVDVEGGHLIPQEAPETAAALVIPHLLPQPELAAADQT